MSQGSWLPKYPEGGRTARDAALPPDPTSDEPLRQPHTLVLYGLALAGMCLAGLPLVLVSFLQAGPVAGAGALLIFGGQVWLFTQIFAGNPVAALVVLLIPVVGTLLAIRFIIDYFRIARWPVACQLAGYFLWLVGAFSSLRSTW